VFRSKVGIALSSLLAIVIGIVVASRWSISTASVRDVERSVGAQRLSAERIGITPAPLASACDEDAEVSVSPSGEFFAIATGIESGFSPLPRSSRLAIFSTDCLARGGDCGISIQGLDGVRIVGWDKKSRYVLLDENGRFLTALKLSTSSSDAITLERVPARDLSSKVVAIEPLMFDRAAEGIVEMLNAADKESKRAVGPNVPLVYAMGQGVVVATLVEARPSLHWAIRKGARYAELPIITPQARRPRLIAGRLGSPIRLSDLGIEIAVDDAGRVSSTSRPFMHPLVSSSTGTIVDWYGLRQTNFIADSGRSRNSVAPPAERGIAAESYVVNAATNGRGSSAEVFNSGEGLAELVLRYNERRWSVTCPSYESSVKFRVEYGDLGNRSRALPIVIAHPLDKIPKGVAVIFGGGPAERADDVRSSASALQFLKFGYEVWLVSYSGSRGGGYDVSKRLANSAMRELATDGLVVARRLELHADVPVILYGTSFGALPALATDGAFKTPHRSIYVAPFFRHRAPSEWIKSGPFSANVGFQTMFENATFGISSADQYGRFNATIEKLLHQRSASSPQLSIHFDKDMVSQRGDQGTAAMGEVVVLPGNHLTATTSPRTWSTISTWLTATAGLGK
jgi:hypothetical protein